MILGFIQEMRESIEEMVPILMAEMHPPWERESPLMLISGTMDHPRLSVDNWIYTYHHLDQRLGIIIITIRQQW